MIAAESLLRWAEIDRAAITHNVRTLKALGGGALIAVVKANGYGHGSLTAAEAALEGGAEIVATADLEEALHLRRSGFDAPLMCWLHGPTTDFHLAVREHIEIAVSSVAQMQSLAAAARDEAQPVSAQIKVDTGLRRNGAAPDEWAELFALSADLQREGAVTTHGIFSHLANTSEATDRKQAEQFDRAIDLLRAVGVDPQYQHLSSSAATLSRPALRYNALRVGVAIYGLNPFGEWEAEPHDWRDPALQSLAPAMSVRARLISVRDVPRGAGVSYDHAWVAPRDSVLGLVPFGYADGMPRALGDGDAWVSVNGERCPIVGRIAMDQCVIDLTDCQVRPQVGDLITLFGAEEGVPSADNWAAWIGTINYEVVTGIGPRVPRLVTDTPSPMSDSSLAGALVNTSPFGGANL